jgi:hypothetical protein
MIGASVRRGAMATFRPSRKPKRMVWLTTSAVVGPGVKPPASPKTQPDARNVRSSIMLRVYLVNHPRMKGYNRHDEDPRSNSLKFEVP